MLLGIHKLFQPIAKALNDLSEVKVAAEQLQKIRKGNNQTNYVQGSDNFLQFQGLSQCHH